MEALQKAADQEKSARITIGGEEGRSKEEGRGKAAQRILYKFKEGVRTNGFLERREAERRRRCRRGSQELRKKKKGKANLGEGTTFYLVKI